MVVPQYQERPLAELFTSFTADTLPADYANWGQPPAEDHPLPEDTC